MQKVAQVNMRKFDSEPLSYPVNFSDIAQFDYYLFRSLEHNIWNENYNKHQDINSDFSKEKAIYLYF